MFRIIAGSARADGLKWGATRALLLASTALATGIFAGAMVYPQTAQAKCTPSNFPSAPPERTFVWNDRVEGQGVNVTCDTDTTTSNLSIGLPAPAIGVPVNGLIFPGVTVDGLGLSFVSRLGNPLSVTNAGTVTVTTATAQPVTALELIGSGGDVTYTGNGSVINGSGGITGIGGALLITNTGIGNVMDTTDGMILSNAG